MENSSCAAPHRRARRLGAPNLVVFLSSLTLTRSLQYRWRVMSPTASFLSNSGKKRGKETPQGTDGSLTSLRGSREKNDKPFSRANWNSIFPWQRHALPHRLTITVAPADSRALFAPANRGAASKAPRFICHRQRFGAFRSAAHPYGGRSAYSYILEGKRQRSEKQRQYNISTHEVTLLPIRDVGIKAVRAI